jgi:hypothetical protein
MFFYNCRQILVKFVLKNNFSYHKTNMYLFNLFVYLVCWGYTVAFTKVLIIHQIYHTCIHTLHCSLLSLPAPIPGIVSTDLIFSFTYMCTEYCHHIHPPLPSPHNLHLTDTNPQAGPALPSCSLFLFKKTVCLR